MSATTETKGFEKYFGDERIEAIREVTKEILINGAYKATKYLSDKLTVKATRKLFRGKVSKGKAVDIVLTIGPPNYEERGTIKRAKKTGKAPVETTIKYPPKARR